MTLFLDSLAIQPASQPTDQPSLKPRLLFITWLWSACCCCCCCPLWQELSNSFQNIFWLYEQTADMLMWIMAKKMSLTSMTWLGTEGLELLLLTPSMAMYVLAQCPPQSSVSLKPRGPGYPSKMILEHGTTLFFLYWYCIVLLVSQKSDTFETRRKQKQLAYIQLLLLLHGGLPVRVRVRIYLIVFGSHFRLTSSSSKAEETIFTFTGFICH